MNDAMRRFQDWVGQWDVTTTHAWFLESMDTKILGSATIEWLADAFLVLTSRHENDSTFEIIVGRSDARDRYVAFTHDNRGVYRVFDMSFGDGEWTLLREDPDFHQRLVITAEPDRMNIRADASEDAGRTWRKDLDYILDRRRTT